MPTKLVAITNTILSQQQLNDFQSECKEGDAIAPENFEILQTSGFLIQAVPEELGGLGLTQTEVCQQIRDLADSVPAIALAANTHIAWTGIAADLWYAGDTSLEWLLRDACDGHFFAMGHLQSCNDKPPLKAQCKAERVDGGYCLSGQLSIHSATPNWTRMGVCGSEEAKVAASPTFIHAFVARDAEGLTIDAADEALLDAAFVPDKYIARIVEGDRFDGDSFLHAMSTWWFLGHGCV